MSRRRTTEVDLALVDTTLIASAASKLEQLQEAISLVESWTPAEKALLDELLTDAETELQREMLLRVVTARHTPAEVHAFADALRALTDEDILERCTLSDDVEDIPEGARFEAELDPLYALELNGTDLTPRIEDDPGPAYAIEGDRPRPRAKAPAVLFSPTLPQVYAPQGSGFDATSSVTARTVLDGRVLGDSPGSNSTVIGPPPFRPAPSSAATGTSGQSAAQGGGAKAAVISAEVLSVVVRPHGIAFRDVLVDGKGLTLERALEHAVKALALGIPVPVTLGRSPGERGQQVLMLQVQPALGSRAYQLHDPVSRETVWANERDLLARVDLPFAAKQWRRITALALPVQRAK